MKMLNRTHIGIAAIITVAPKRAETTTPLQTPTMLNPSFTPDMAAALAERLKHEASEYK